MGINQTIHPVTTVIQGRQIVKHKTLSSSVQKFGKHIRDLKQGKRTPKIVLVVLQHCVIKVDFCLGINPGFIARQNGQGGHAEEGTCCTPNT